MGAQTSQSIRLTTQKVLPIVAEAYPPYMCVCGGSSNVDAFLRTALRFEHTSSIWKCLPSMAKPRRCAAATAISGWLYVCGGDDGSRQAANVVERICPHVGPSPTWEEVAPMFQGRWGAVAMAIAHELYVCGGDRGECCVGSVERLDTKEGSWAKMPDMGAKRWCGAGAALGGQIYMCGGHDGQNCLASVERFDPSIGKWVPLEPMRFPRWGCAAAVIATRLFVCGGENLDTPTPLPNVESYDTRIGIWDSMVFMAEPRTGACAVALSGKLLIFGGKSFFGRTASTECFDQERGRWVDTKSMPVALAHAACALVTA